MSIPVTLLLSGALGASIAAAAGKLHRSRSSVAAHALASVFALELAVLMPAAAVLLWRYPDWSCMYVAWLAAWGPHRAWCLAMQPLIAWASWTTVRRWGHGRLVVALFALSLAALLAIGWRRWWWVGSQAQWRASDEFVTLLVTLPATRLGWLVMGYAALLGTGWTLTFRRVRRLAVAGSTGDQPTDTAAVVPRDEAREAAREGSRHADADLAASDHNGLQRAGAETAGAAADHPEPQPAPSSAILPPPARRGADRIE